MSVLSSNTILVAIDGSRASRVAAEIATEIARLAGQEIHGLYVIDAVLTLERYVDYKAELDPDIAAQPAGQVMDLFEEQGSRAIEWLENHCRGTGVPVTTEILFGGVAELIVDQSQEVGLLALGRRGHGHANDPMHLGSIFRHVAHHSDVPILVGGEMPTPPRRLLLAYDGSEKARRALDWASRLQCDLESQVIAVSVAKARDGSKDWITAMRTEIERSRLVDFKFESREGEPAREVVAAAEENRASLILAGRYQHSEFVDWFVGSTLDRILRETPLTVLAA